MRIRYGEISNCRVCGQDIQFLSKWVDRGNNTKCPAYVDKQKGEIVKNPRTIHKPQKENSK
jgi:hypothetical protein